MCKAIEHSTTEQKRRYLSEMENTCPYKAQLIKPWLKQGSILDVGCADASFVSHILQETKVKKIYGIDLSSEVITSAEQSFGGNKVEFQVADVRNVKLDSPVDNAVCSSVLHEVYSYGQGLYSVQEALNNIHANLTTGGRIIIRDFVKPMNTFDGITLRHYKSDMVEGHTCSNFTDVLYHDYPQYRDYVGLNMGRAYEYIFHKDYHLNWETEIQETYGFSTLNGMKILLENAGFKVIHAAELDNEWIIQNRLKGKVELRGANGVVPFPKYQMLVVAEKE